MNQLILTPTTKNSIPKTPKLVWHKLTGGLRRRWGNKPLNTFPEALEALVFDAASQSVQLSLTVFITG